MRAFCLVFLAIALLVSAVRPAAAQRGDRALFGGGNGNTDQSLTATSNLGASFYQALGPQSDVANGLLLPRSTWLGQASTQLSYAANLRFLKASASVGEFASYYAQPEKTWVRQPTYNADVSTAHTWHPSRRSILTGNLGGTFLPAYWATTPGQGLELTTDSGSAGSDLNPSLLLPPDVTSLKGQSLNLTAGAQVSHTLSRRVSLLGSYAFGRRLDYGRPDDFDLLSHMATGGISVAVTRHLSLRGTYRFSDTTTGPPGSRPVRSHLADFGVDYNRGGTLQLTKRTRLTFNGGVSSGVDSHRAQRYFLVGDARLTHEMGRTWSASLGYDRNLNFSSLFQEPVLADTVLADFGGLITSRLSFRSQAGYSHGAVGFVGADNGLLLINGLVRLQAALTRYLAVGASYAYYDRTIGALVVRPAELSRKSQNQVARVYITAWAPIYRHVRRPSATR